MLVTNASFTWHQILTGVPLQIVSSFGVRFASAALPAPGFVDVVGFGSGSVVHTTVSNDDITTVNPFQRSVTYDLTSVTQSIQASFPGLTPAAAQQLAGDLLGSAFTITVAPGVTVRSVQTIRYSGLRALQVFSD